MLQSIGKILFALLLIGLGLAVSFFFIFAVKETGADYAREAGLLFAGCLFLLIGLYVYRRL